MLLPADLYTDIRNKALETLGMFGLLDKKDLIPLNLSEGDRKLLDVAIAFAMGLNSFCWMNPPLGRAKEILQNTGLLKLIGR